MDFLIVPKNFPVQPLGGQIAGWQHTGNTVFDLYYDPRQAEIRPVGSGTLLLLGDFWNVPEPDGMNDPTTFVNRLVRSIKGNYYGILIENESMVVFSCFLNLMPVYYSERDRIISSAFPLFRALGLRLTVSERYIFETLLFNYPFFNATIFDEIKLLATHHLLEIKGGSWMETMFFNTRSFFSDEPAKGKKIHDALAEAFIRTVDDYMPDKGSTVTFTGGFDGRTIVSCALHLNKDFRTVAFGKADDEDVRIPMSNARELGLEFLHLESTDQQYISHHYTTDSLSMSAAGGGFNGFLYPHFLYIAREAARHSDFLVTGCGGSELFRAAHNAGAVVSQALYDVLTIDGADDLKQALLASPKLKILRKEVRERVIEGFMDDLLEYRSLLGEFGTTNRKLYYFMHNETLRKLFGQWICNQAKHIRVRSPFLDFSFIEAVYNSNLAGAYNDFFTHNPIKRFKGQWLYSLIISKTNRIIFRQKTGKGYPPSHILTVTGKLRLIPPFFKRRLIRKVTREDIDNLGILSGLDYYIHHFAQKSPDDYFIYSVIKELEDKLMNGIEERDRDILLQYHSFKNAIGDLL